MCVRTILRDEILFPDAHAFNPERFLTPAVDEAIRGRTSLALEDGGRDHALKRSCSRLHSRCPDAHLAECSAWLLIVSMIATLDIGKAMDEHGVQVEPEVVRQFDLSVISIHVVAGEA